VDSNVLIVANGDESEQAENDCMSRCEEFLIELQENGVLVLDDGGEILSEYGNKCSFAGAPGLGDMFFRWAFDTQFSHSVRVSINSHPTRVFEEFPDTAALSDFDRSDRKFVAVVLSSPVATKVANAVDSDWAEHAEAIRDAGVVVEELCPWCLKNA